MRVQIPVYTDRWMMGDRYGDVIKIVTGHRINLPDTDIAHVKLDKSNKIVRVILADCTEV